MIMLGFCWTVTTWLPIAGEVSAREGGGTMAQRQPRSHTVGCGENKNGGSGVERTTPIAAKRDDHEERAPKPGRASSEQDPHHTHNPKDSATPAPPRAVDCLSMLFLRGGADLPREGEDAAAPHIC